MVNRTVDEARLSPVGRWLMAQLRRREMSRSDLARACDIPASTVSKWLYGDTPTPASCDLIADAFMLPLDEVLRVVGHRPELYLEGQVLREFVAAARRVPEEMLVPLLPALRGMAQPAEVEASRRRLRELVAPASPEDDEDEARAGRLAAAG